MGRIKDINGLGTAFTVVQMEVDCFSEQKKSGTKKTLSNIFAHGLLGQERLVTKDGKVVSPFYRNEERVVDKEKWTQHVRAQSKLKKSAPIFFNIMGRSQDSSTDGRPLSRLDWVWQNVVLTSEGVALTFDLSKFTEIASPKAESIGHENITEVMPQKPYTYAVHPQIADSLRRYFKKIGIQKEDELQAALTPGSEALKRAFKDAPLKIRELLNAEGYILPRADYGFFLPFKIPSKYFDGLVLRVNSHRDKSTIVEELARNVFIDQQMYVPVYNVDGGLIWPKHMSYEEIKKFVSERDKSGI